MTNKVIPHTANAVTLAATNKPGQSENLVYSQKFSVPEAPADGKIYGRKDGEWVEIGGSSSSEETNTPDSDTTTDTTE